MLEEKQAREGGKGENHNLLGEGNSQGRMQEWGETGNSSNSSLGCGIE